MKSLATTPVVLICSAIILVGLFGLFWALAKLKNLKSAPNGGSFAGTGAAPASDFLDIGRPAMSAVPTPPPAPAVSKEVAERLESMTHRLAEMQAVLAKQSAGGASDASGAVGQGFSPETIDKLLKIIGNVMQQVDILHKSVAAPKEPSAVPPETITKV